MHDNRRMGLVRDTCMPEAIARIEPAARTALRAPKMVFTFTSNVPVPVRFDFRPRLFLPPCRSPMWHSRSVVSPVDPAFRLGYRPLAMRDLAEAALDAARRAGASYADVRAVSTRQRTLASKNGRV